MEVVVVAIWEGEAVTLAVEAVAAAVAVFLEAAAVQ
jgi:hypothetical protein